LVIKYKLGLNGDGEDYAYLVSHILQNTNSNVIKTDDEIIIFMEGDEESIKGSFALLGEKLPLSLYLAGQTVEEAAFMPPNRQSFKESSYLSMHPHLAREIIDEASENYFSIGGSVSVDGEKVADKKALKNSLQNIVSKLKDGKKISIQNESSSFTISTLPGDAVLLTNLKETALSLFTISTDEALTLSTMERPFVLKLLENKFKLICFANDALTLLLSKLACDSGIDALYIGQGGNGDSNVVYSGIKGDAPSRKVLFFSGSDRFFLNEEFTAETIDTEKSSLFFDLNISKDFGVYAVKEKGISKKVAGAVFFEDDLLASISSAFDFGAKLASNFEVAFIAETKALKEFKTSGNSINDFFLALSLLFGADAGFAHVASLANGADIAGGVKLDFVLQKDQNGVALDLKKCFASILSYKLAGVENNILAYSVFESAVDFLIVSQDEAKKSFDIKQLFVGGEFLLSPVFVSKLKSKIKNIDIDMALNRLPSSLQGLYEIAR
jgi:hypothetical protein